MFDIWIFLMGFAIGGGFSAFINRPKRGGDGEITPTKISLGETLHPPVNAKVFSGNGDPCLWGFDEFGNAVEVRIEHYDVNGQLFRVSVTGAGGHGRP